MSVPAKKAAEAVAKKVVPAASRAISAAEAPSIAPAALSSNDPKDTSMPWNGWFSSFLSSKMGPEKYDVFKSYFIWRPQDIHDLQQVPNPNVSVPISKDGKVKAAFRTPSPGSTTRDGSHLDQRQPTEDEGTLYDDPFFVAHYPRDTARRYQDPAFPDVELERLKLDLLNQDDANVQDAQAEIGDGAKSSPGNKGTFATGKSTFDTTGGLRAAMSTNHETLEASLDSFMPNHLPVPEWWENQEEIVAWCEDQDIPVPIGKTGYGTVPREGRIARW